MVDMAMLRGKMTMPVRPSEINAKTIVFLVFIGSFLGFGVLCYAIDIPIVALFLTLLRWLQGVPLIISGPLFSIIFGITVTCFIPGTPLNMGAGIVWGTWVGAIFVWIGCVLCESAGFLLARFLIGDTIQAMVDKRPKLARFQRALTHPSPALIGLTRLSPLFPFPYLNYIYGLSAVSYLTYIIPSALGCIPGMLLYTYLGGLLADLSDLEGQSLSSHAGVFTLVIIGSVVLFFTVTYLAYREISIKLEAEPEPKLKTEEASPSPLAWTAGDHPV